MKNKSYIWISFIILVFGIYFIPKIVNRFKDGAVVEADRLNKTNNALIEIAKVPSFEFINQNRDTINQDFYKGKVYLVEFFFTSCPTICPIMNENMVKIQNEFKFENNFGIASFTIDSVTDTPEVLKEHAAEIGAVSKNWNFLTGNQDDIFSVAKKFNMYVGKNDDAPGGFEHSGLFAIIDKNGKIRSRLDESGNPVIYYDGTEEAGVEMIKEDIKKLLAE
ncbi:SCO family protein [Myroides ceti]|uniref:SCO family protein n=1 Tax=Paenimyroides ceti TaxID=395087 RepID=A0ABT8CVA4_9FLAO|nr:SCO family protein [Paenimyroides ceti]MDN3708086.1 SCO family protein [Paenimyroides ceti]